jgi:hypothetical protein
MSTAVAASDADTARSGTKKAASIVMAFATGFAAESVTVAGLVLEAEAAGADSAFPANNIARIDRSDVSLSNAAREI